MIETYTVVAHYPVPSAACRRDESIVEYVEALTPAHAAWRFTRRYCQVHQLEPTALCILAVFVGRTPDEFSEETYRDTNYMTLLDQEFERNQTLEGTVS